jgi:hypothetical protein
MTRDLSKPCTQIIRFASRDELHLTVALSSCQLPQYVSSQVHGALCFTQFLLQASGVSNDFQGIFPRNGF